MHADMLTGLHLKCQLLLLDFNQIWNVLTHYLIRLQIQNFLRILSLSLEFLHAQRRTSILTERQSYQSC
jgi:hypothetical protein